MFETRAAARAALTSTFAPAFVEAAMRALMPAIAFEPIEEPAEPSLGGTRIGGLPDLPPGLDWPRPEPHPDPEATARCGNKNAAAEMRAHMARNPPFTFFAQVDLAEAAALGLVATGLPAKGRLLFFYDLAVGPGKAAPAFAA